MENKYWFYSFITNDGTFCGASDEHPFRLLKNSNGKYWEIISFQEITKEEYDLWFSLDLN